MRIAIGSLVLLGLLFGEALHQRHQHFKREFLTSLESLRSSLGSLQIAYVAYHRASTRFATAMTTILAEARRRNDLPQP